VATDREAHYVLDEILGNATDLPITEHATDTHGVTLVNFALFDLVGLQFSPRIRDLGKITLYRSGAKATTERAWPRAGPLLTRRLDLDLIAEHWDELLRLAASLKFGHATASLVVGKLSASSRQNTLAAALKEYGALPRTVYAAHYLTDPGYRRRITRQLNKGESLRALRRDLLYAHQGTIRRRHLEAQTEQAWCLTLATNAVLTWTTEYYGPHLPGAERARQLLRRDHRRRRPRTGQTRPHRLPAAAHRARHVEGGAPGRREPGAAQPHRRRWASSSSKALTRRAWARSVIAVARASSTLRPARAVIARSATSVTVT